MKITKEMGRACLSQLARLSKDRNVVLCNEACFMGIFNLIGTERWRMDHKHAMTALAMCAAIAGVKPE